MLQELVGQLRERNFGDFHLVTLHQVQQQINRTAKDRTCNLEIQKRTSTKVRMFLQTGSQIVGTTG